MPSAPSQNSQPEVQGPFFRINAQFAFAVKWGFPSVHDSEGDLGLMGGVNRPPMIEFAVYQFIPIGVHERGAGETPQGDPQRREFGNYARRWVWYLRCQEDLAQTPIAAREFENHFGVPLYLYARGHSR